MSIEFASVYYGILELAAAVGAISVALKQPLAISFIVRASLPPRGHTRRIRREGRPAWAS